MKYVGCAPPSSGASRMLRRPSCPGERRRLIASEKLLSFPGVNEHVIDALYFMAVDAMFLRMDIARLGFAAHLLTQWAVVMLSMNTIRCCPLWLGAQVANVSCAIHSSKMFMCALAIYGP